MRLLFHFVLVVFGFFWEILARRRPLYTCYIPALETSFDLRALFTPGRQQEPGTKRKNCTLHLVAFAVSLFCWFWVVLQSSGWAGWQNPGCIAFSCFAAPHSTAHRSSHINQHLHPSTPTFCPSVLDREPDLGIKMMAPRDAGDLCSFAARRLEICELLLLLRCFCSELSHLT